MLIYDCPRCGVKGITFDTQSYIQPIIGANRYEIFGCCRSCNTSTVFLVRNTSRELFQNVMKKSGIINPHIEVVKVVNIVPINSNSVPKFLPEEIENPFSEALACQAIQAWNAAGCMFRTTVDLATKEQLQKLQAKKPPKDLERNLSKRIVWLFSGEYISERLKDLSTCIRKDGNDAAHEANLGKVDVEDLCDFTTLLLEELFTTPKRIEEATYRQQIRHKTKENENEM